jgi:hypothetical protein
MTKDDITPGLKGRPNEADREAGRDVAAAMPNEAKIRKSVPLPEQDIALQERGCCVDEEHETSRVLRGTAAFRPKRTAAAKQRSSNHWLKHTSDGSGNVYVNADRNVANAECSSPATCGNHTAAGESRPCRDEQRW